MYTTIRTEQNGLISSVVRFASLSQAREWAAANGHQVVKGYAAKKALRAGACIRMMRADGRVTF